MAEFVLRCRLFISSYAPLFAMLALRFQSPVLVVSFSAAALIGAGTLILMLRAARRIHPQPHEIKAVADEGPEVAGYVATYLLPFLTVPEPSGRELLAYLLFLILVGVVYVRSEMVRINPLLYLLGYRLWEVTTGDGWKGYLISRGRPVVGTVVLASRLLNTVAFQRGHDQRVAA